MCKCLATGSIGYCIHAVQQCGCKIIDREQNMFVMTLLYCLIKTANKTEAMFCKSCHKGIIQQIQFQDDFLIILVK